MSSVRLGWGASRMPGKTARPTQSFLVRSAWRPPCCRGLRCVDLAPRPGWAGWQTVPVCFGRLSPAAGSRASREVQTTGRDVWSLRMRWLRHHKSGACTRTGGRIRTAQVRGTFIQGARSRGSQNRRGGDDGTRSLAVADRNSDPDHPADLAVWRPSRVKCALTSSQRAGSLRTAGFALFVCA